MTRNDARMIAEELFKLCNKNNLLPVSDNYLSVREAAALLKLSVKTIYYKAALLGGVNTGGTLRFSERALRAYIERK